MSIYVLAFCFSLKGFLVPVVESCRIGDVWGSIRAPFGRLRIQ